VRVNQKIRNLALGRQSTLVEKRGGGFKNVNCLSSDHKNWANVGTAVFQRVENARLTFAELLQAINPPSTAATFVQKPPQHRNRPRHLKISMSRKFAARSQIVCRLRMYAAYRLGRKARRTDQKKERKNIMSLSDRGEGVGGPIIQE
jgi:uncharacterized protein YjhX (UPF0386 family)